MSINGFEYRVVEVGETTYRPGVAGNGPMNVWRHWADDVRGDPVRSGHFIPEEAPEGLVPSLRAFLA